ncbi:hypothetical protein [Streptomyces thermolilacinus]|uniref:Uncharacterized protein n=1 Tax=Streptomyces thermolilacinus SPC6 TaxID=1306406 RepID=A0A1D3DV47_9ACTN|nr:hypothetical protein [Streptomyces thermolilacinus]OEJ96193.1 hypothetical protein J116_018685 [Streptomyces thermolilacinus SPC6]
MPRVGQPDDPRAGVSFLILIRNLLLAGLVLWAVARGLRLAVDVRTADLLQEAPHNRADNGPGWQPALASRTVAKCWYN